MIRYAYRWRAQNTCVKGAHEEGSRPEGSRVLNRDAESAKTASIEEWLESEGLKAKSQKLDTLLNHCQSTSALKLTSPLGRVHGDFAPWNVLRTSAVSRQPLAVSQKQSKAESHELKANCSLTAIDWEFSRADTPLIFDYAYAARCYSMLLNRTIKGIEPNLWDQLVALGELWFELRQQL